jgi:hypothetical protein
MICACVHAQRHASQFLAVQYRCAPVLDCHVEIAFKSSIEAAVSGGAIFDFDSIISPIFNLVLNNVNKVTYNFIERDAEHV